MDAALRASPPAGVLAHQGGVLVMALLILLYLLIVFLAWSLGDDDTMKPV